mmetsp:Transcript_11566/g.18337  ORF Transcript_11566/g.18337 Transcript_11566/m.18337 type:complete len:212 (-) Transcript_11566:70-705(-)
MSSQQIRAAYADASLDERVEKYIICFPVHIVQKRKNTSNTFCAAILLYALQKYRASDAVRLHSTRVHLINHTPCLVYATLHGSIHQFIEYCTAGMKAPLAHFVKNLSRFLECTFLKISSENGVVTRSWGIEIRHVTRSNVARLATIILEFLKACAVDAFRLACEGRLLAREAQSTKRRMSKKCDRENCDLCLHRRESLYTLLPHDAEAYGH